MWVYVLYIIWLMSLAYVDYKTGYVYSRMSVAGIIPACICIVRLITDYRDNICDAFGCILVMILLARLAGHFNLAGGGDSDVLVITSVVNTVYLTENGIISTVALLLYNLILLYFSMLLFILRHIKHVNWRRMKMDRGYPLLPSIYMSTVISGIIIQLLYN